MSPEMSVASRTNWRSRLARFRRDERGNFAIITGLAAMAIMMSAGIAFDYSRIYSARSQVSSALDAAVLAAGASLSNGNSTAVVEQEFNDFFQTNLGVGMFSPDDVTVDELKIDPAAGTVEANATAHVPTTFMALGGTDAVDVGTSSEAAFSSDQVEVAMVLDVTGSMSGTKIADLKAAAKDAVDILIPAGSPSTKMRIGLVPYSWSVNAGPYAAIASANKSTRCVTERAGLQALTDASYVGNPVGADPRVVGPRLCPSQPVVGLTNDRVTLRSDIDRFAADGWTAGHIGVAWGYYMLSENWRWLWKPSERPALYADKVKKIVVLMTDGQFNTYYDGVPLTEKMGEQASQSMAAAVALCKNMKAMKGVNPGITIYSIAFDIASIRDRNERKSVIDTLSACASGASHFFDAANGAQLRDAFRSIAIDIQKLRLAR